MHEILQDVIISLSSFFHLMLKCARFTHYLTMNCSNEYSCIKIIILLKPHIVKSYIHNITVQHVITLGRTLYKKFSIHCKIILNETNSAKKIISINIIFCHSFNVNLIKYLSKSTMETKCYKKVSLLKYLTYYYFMFAGCIII